jgi:hypothetical protein
LGFVPNHSAEEAFIPMNEIAKEPPACRPGETEKILLRIARECIEEGPGYSQETVVLRKAAEQLEIGEDLRGQQGLLTAWQNLFRNGQLSWGYNVENPSAPFFHLSVQ